MVINKMRAADIITQAVSPVSTLGTGTVATIAAPCASAGKDDFVELLLKYKARTDVESLDGFKAIDLAVTPKIVKLLKNANIS